MNLTNEEVIDEFNKLVKMCVSGMNPTITTRRRYAIIAIYGKLLELSSELLKLRLQNEETEAGIVINESN